MPALSRRAALTGAVAMVPVAMANAAPPLIWPETRTLRAADDSMAPFIRQGDLVVVTSVESFRWDGCYTLREERGAADVWRCQSVGRQGILVKKDNPDHPYSRVVMSAAEFAAAVVGQVGAVGRITDASVFCQA
ncbi:hypothetical protein [Roseomonas sp. BN140053]|uniref:hypothetical protein n=1 Tax=Roseomonas sp. BN140053 TaxID=3391898 RepID=UPI0039ED83F7